MSSVESYKLDPYEKLLLKEGLKLLKEHRDDVQEKLGGENAVVTVNEGTVDRLIRKLG